MITDAQTSSRKQRKTTTTLQIHGPFPTNRLGMKNPPSGPAPGPDGMGDLREPISEPHRNWYKACVGTDPLRKYRLWSPGDV